MKQNGADPKLTKVYLYLARRDRRGMRVLAVFQGTGRTARVDDLRALGLDPGVESAVAAEVYSHRMEWEPWVEPAADFGELRAKLTRRGYTSLPLASSPSVVVPHGTIGDTSRFPPRRTMTQRGG